MYSLIPTISISKDSLMYNLRHLHHLESWETSRMFATTWNDWPKSFFSIAINIYVVIDM